MPTKVQALKSFAGKPGEGKDGSVNVRRGHIFEVASDNRAKELERRGLVAFAGNAKSRGATAAKTGATASASSSPEDQAPAKPTSKASGVTLKRAPARKTRAKK